MLPPSNQTHGELHPPRRWSGGSAPFSPTTPLVPNNLYLVLDDGIVKAVHLVALRVVVLHLQDTELGSVPRLAPQCRAVPSSPHHPRYRLEVEERVHSPGLGLVVPCVHVPPEPGPPLGDEDGQSCGQEGAASAGARCPTAQQGPPAPQLTQVEAHTHKDDEAEPGAEDRGEVNDADDDVCDGGDDAEDNVAGGGGKGDGASARPGGAAQPPLARCGHALT